MVLEILKYIKENPGASPKDVALALGLDQSSVKKIIYKMRGKGFLEKAGGGYVLTSKGEWFLGKISGKHVEKKTIETETRVSERVERGVEAREEVDSHDLLNRLNDIENKIKKIEAMVENIKRELNSIKSFVEKTIEAERSSVIRRTLPIPVMSIQDAKQTLGPSFDTYRSEGRIVIIGSLVVDRDFYENFKKKFPIMISDKDKLSELEQVLLEEMIRDARVIISSGKQYKLIE